MSDIKFNVFLLGVLINAVIGGYELIKNPNYVFGMSVISFVLILFWVPLMFIKQHKKLLAAESQPNTLLYKFILNIPAIILIPLLWSISTLNIASALNSSKLFSTLSILSGGLFISGIFCAALISLIIVLLIKSIFLKSDD